MHCTNFTSYSIQHISETTAQTKHTTACTQLWIFIYIKSLPALQFSKQKGVVYLGINRKIRNKKYNNDNNDNQTLLD